MELNMNTDRCRSSISFVLRFSLVLILFTLLHVVGTTGAFAQVDRAVLEGTVTDPSGSVIVGASVKVLAVDTHLSEERKTNAKGYYRVSGLAIGGYTVTVANAGFKTKLVDESAKPELWT
jgi:hypothetical protein